MRWIPVSEAPPEREDGAPLSEPLLVWVKRRGWHRAVYWYKRKDFYFLDCEGLKTVNITHYAHIEGPKKKR